MCLLIYIWIDSDYLLMFIDSRLSPVVVHVQRLRFSFINTVANAFLPLDSEVRVHNMNITATVTYRQM